MLSPPPPIGGFLPRHEPPHAFTRRAHYRELPQEDAARAMLIDFTTPEALLDMLCRSSPRYQAHDDAARAKLCLMTHTPMSGRRLMPLPDFAELLEDTDAKKMISHGNLMTSRA